MKNLLPHYYAFEVEGNPARRERAKLHSSVWKEDGHRCASQCELVSGFIQLESISQFYEVRKSYVWAA